MAASLKNITSGASTGASIGTAIAPGIGTAIGTGLGAIGGGLASLGGNAYKNFIKDKFKEFTQKGTTVSDEERSRIGEAMTEAQAQSQAAQEVGRQRSAMALTGGNPVLTGEAKQTAKELGEANRSTAVKADTQARRMALAVDERRQNEDRVRATQQKKIDSYHDKHGSSNKQTVEKAYGSVK